ncbi:MAG: RidA family protein [Pseudomonadota bacterium]|nr:RidA family protein [Pseudomonadota bacterium]
MHRHPVATGAAPAAIGTYSQAIRHGELLFVSGQIPLDPATGSLVGEQIEDQIRQVFDNLRAVTEAGGTTLARALKVTIYLIDLDHFAKVNEIMAEYFPEPFPARAALGVAALPKGAQVEADAIVAC